MTEPRLVAVGLAGLCLLGAVYGATPAALAPAPSDQSEPTTATTTEAGPDQASTSAITMEPTRLEKRYTLDTAAVNRTEAAQINDSLGTFYQRLPENRSARLAQTEQLAADICRRGRTVDPAAVEQALSVPDRDDQLGQAAQTLETNVNPHIDADQVQETIRQADDTDEYTPLVATYNAYYQAACNVDVDRQATLDRFYQASSALGVEFLFVQSGTTYTVDGATPRTDVQSRAMAALQSRFGDDAVQLLLSETHWMSRGDLRNLSGYVREQYRQANLRYDGDVDWAALRARIDSLDGATVLDEADIEAADGETIQNLLERTNTSDQVRCVMNQRSSVDELATQAADITADGKVTAAELQTLPDEPREQVIDCLRTD
ncbi:hypothetical protein EGH22_19505 [Halomicroarcula sp. F28]|uniref:hypothetical protein n=1 Tax=Haloarcula salinisoli TaxID=2487746 RepID=UPI001C72B03D|nr:hypothetical protein [Halomicroarcula salinisoli]MBX0288520.1 hypothetical protein [Halomicroarcula salinisoli]